MWLFKKRKQKESGAEETKVSDKVAGKIAGIGITMQSKFANGMNKIFEGVNAKRLKIVLGVFCICCGGYSIYLLARAIISPDKKQSTFKIDQMDVPKHFDKTGDEMIAPESNVDEETFYKIQQFKSYMDSLKQKKSYLYDSIITARPFLMDTVVMLEEIYHSQKQK